METNVATIQWQATARARRTDVRQPYQAEVEGRNQRYSENRLQKKQNKKTRGFLKAQKHQQETGYPDSDSPTVETITGG